MGEQSPPGGAQGSAASEAQTFIGADNRIPSYSDVARRNFPYVTIDLVAREDERSKRLGFTVIADIIFDHLKLKKDEFTRFRTFKEEEGKQTLKIRTMKSINVRERYGAAPVFEVADQKEGQVWRASIRGAEGQRNEEEETLKLRVINPPEDALFGEVKQEIEKFSVITSRIREEVVPVEEEPRLAGCPTGVLNLRIRKIPKIPSFIMIRRQRVRIHVALPPNVCLRCRENGHRAAECSSRRNDPRRATRNPNAMVGNTDYLGDDPATEEGTIMPNGMTEHTDPEDDSATGNESVPEGPNENIESESEYDSATEKELALEVTIKGEKSKKNSSKVVKPVRGGGSTQRGRGHAGKREGLRSTS